MYSAGEGDAEQIKTRKEREGKLDMSSAGVGKTRLVEEKEKLNKMKNWCMDSVGDGDE